MKNIIAAIFLFTTTFVVLMNSINGLSTVEICEKPGVQGHTYCRSETQRWTFNSEDEKCIQMGSFSGCSQTENNFDSEESCQETCGNYKNELNKRKKTYPDACNLPSGQSGKCRAAFRKYYYDQNTNTCKKYIYGGCGGNRNSFNSLDECIHYCGGSSEPQQELNSNVLD